MRIAAALGVLAMAVVGCSSHHSSNGAPNPGSTGTVNPMSPPAASPGPVVSSIGGVQAPVTPAQLGSVFGTSLSGPRAAANGQPTLLYGDVASSSHLVVSVTVYSPQLLARQGTTPDEFYSQSEDPTAEHVTGIGQKAYIVQDQITVLTAHNYVLIVAANQQVREAQLESAARSAASKL